MRGYKIILLLVLALAVTDVAAETLLDRMYWKHEVRVGWGDQLFETLMWHNPTSIVTTMPAAYTETYHENYHYDQHLWAEYQYRFNKWLGVGGMVDLSEVHWDDVRRDGTGAELDRSTGHYFCNAVVMPTVRFTYFHHDYVDLYSGVGLGIGLNSGTETNSKGHRTDVGAAVNITVIGLSVNYQRWFISVEGGGLYSLKNANTIFMASSRIMSVGVGARW